MSKDSTSDNGKWRYDGVKVVSGQHLDVNTPQTEGMNRAAAINHATAGAEKLWAGTVHIHPDAKTGAHHHGDLESIIYIVSGQPTLALPVVGRSGRPSPHQSRLVLEDGRGCAPGR
jgi:uncharacterized RmlC-like cupin family protein